MRSSKPWLGLGFLLLMLMAGGCNDSAQVTTTTTSSVLSTPEETQTVQSPVGTPSTELANWDATPAPTKAIVRGRIPVTQSSIVVGELYLSNAVPTDREGIELLELDQESSPRAAIDRSTGEFVFVNIEPGRYGLIVWEPQNSFPVEDPDTGETLFVDLSAGEAIDLGTLEIP